MDGSRRWLIALLAAALMFGLAFGAQAQTSGTVVLGQPLPNQVAAGQTLNFDYTLAQPSQVTLQALGDTAQPMITILRDGKPVAQQANAGGALTVALNALLDAGTYVVQVGTANNTAGLVVLVLQSETPVTTTALAAGSPVSGAVSPSAPLALYTFSAAAEPAYLYVESGLPDGGVSVRLMNTTTTQASEIAPELLGARLHIPAGSAAYQVEVRDGGSGSSVPFTICLALVSVGGCEAGTASAPPIEAPVVVAPAATPDYVPCTITPAVAGGVNIRQSASLNAMIVGKLNDGDVADVIGISPDGQFYNILHSGTNAWIAKSVVTSSGNCGTDTILVINPPPVIAEQVQPSAPPTSVPQPSGPCLITIQNPLYIYTTTNSDQSNLFDQVQPGYQLSPVGRTADGSWWQTNYFGSWIPTSTFGNGAQVSGDCSSLPITSP